MLENRLCRIVTVNEILFGFVPFKLMMCLSRLQERYHSKVKALYVRFVDLEKAFY